MNKRRVEKSFFARFLALCGGGLLAAGVLLAGFLGCEVGLGEELDLKAPRLVIANYKSGQFVDTQLHLQGTCVDEGQGTESVVIEQLASDGTFKEIKRATIHGDTWECTLDFSEGEVKNEVTGVGDGHSTLDIDGKVEGTKVLRITATDKAGNVNGMSVKQVLFFVDKTPPKGSGWYIDRLLNGINCEFFDSSEEGKVNAVETSQKLGIPANKDKAQNVKFTICGTMGDTMGVSDVELSLWEYFSDKKGTKDEYLCVGEIPSDRFTIKTDDEGNPTSFYTPQFDITHDELVALGKKMDPPQDYSQGVHIFEARYYAEDVVTNPAPNVTTGVGQPGTDDYKVDVPIGLFIWQPESDNPHVELSDNSVLIKETNGDYKTEHGLYTASYNVNSTVMLNIFDDDALNRTYWAFMGEDRYNKLVTALNAESPASTDQVINSKKLLTNIEKYSTPGGTPTDEKPFSKIVSTDERDYSLSINTGDNPGTFHLVVLSIDGSDNRLPLLDANGVAIKVGNPERDREESDTIPWGFRDLIAYVKDSNAPMLFVTQPQSNTAPNIDALVGTPGAWTGAKFKVAGQVMDTKGCETVDFVWVPSYAAASADEKADLAKAWLYSKEYKGTTYQNKHINETLPNGAVMWSVKLAAKSPAAGFTLTEPQKQTGSLFLKQTFDFDLDALTDFKKDATHNDTTADKFFAILASRIDESGSGTSATTYGEHVIAADNDAPTITVDKPAEGQAIKPGTSSLEVEFYAQKETGVPIDESKYELRVLTRDAQGSWVATPASSLKDTTGAVYITPQSDKSKTIHYESGDVTYAIKCFKLSSAGVLALQSDAGEAPTFEFYAEDIFGNGSTSQTTISVGDEPKLMSITAKYANNRIFKIGDEIEFNAVFNGTVKIANEDMPQFDASGAMTNAGKVKLKLTGITKNGVSGTQYATVKSITGSTIIFSYTVAEGDSSAKLDVDVNTPGGTGVVGGMNPFDITNITVEGNSVIPINNGEVQVGTVLPKNVVTNSANPRAMTYKIDGSRPIITSVTIQTDDGKKESNTKWWCKAGKSITAIVALDKDCNVMGDPKLRLKVTSSSDATKSDYIDLPYKTSIKSSGTTSVYFTHVVTEKDFNGVVSFEKASAMEASDIASITSTAGNASSGFGAGIMGATGDNTIEIDTVVPGTPSVTYWLPKTTGDPEKYLPKYSTTNCLNKDITIKIEGTETGATAEWMTQGTWQAISAGDAILTSGGVSLSDGEYEISARQYDAAGNYSNEAARYKFDIAKGFPEISINCSNADGHYGVGRVLNFTVTLTRPLAKCTNHNVVPTFQVSNRGNVAKFIGTTSDDVLNKRTMQFEYTVEAGDDFTVNCDAYSVAFPGYSDKYGNLFKYNTECIPYSRPYVVVDGSSPIVEKVEQLDASDNVVDPGRGASGSPKFKIYFNKKVNKGNGKIVLRLSGNWVVPPVMSVDDFNIVYNNASQASKAHLIRKTASGDNIIDSEVVQNDVVGSYHGTGIGVGPYLKTTHGVKLVGSEYVPDTEAKYVLRFDFDAGGSNTVNCAKKGEAAQNISMAQVREAFRSSGYSKREIDVTNAQVVLWDNGGKTAATVTFGADLLGKYPTTLEPGRLWEVVLSKGSFIDDTGNEFGKYMTGDADGVVVTISTEANGELAKIRSAGNDVPYIRTERYSYGRKMKGPSSASTSYISGNDNSLDAPTGKIRVRLDCQSDKTAITYQKSTPATVRLTGSSGANVYNYSGEWGKTQAYYYKESAALTTSTALSASTSYNRGSIFLIDSFGSGATVSAGRALIKAVAGGQSAFEGVYCSVVCFNNPVNGGVGIHGSTWVKEMGESPQITSFPLNRQMAGSPYVRKCYDNGGDHYWVTFEIITKACIGVRTSDWGNTWGPLYYGGYTWASGCKPWGVN